MSRSAVLVSGASFAGLATAWWMTKLDYQVTLIEVAKDLRKGGTPVLKLRAKEETISASLKQYLAPYFPGMHIDVEYNLMGEIPKSITYCDEPQEVRPDLIVHIRDNRAKGIPDSKANVLVVELNKDTNRQKSARDISKLVSTPAST